jgi:hypothetical protein
MSGLHERIQAVVGDRTYRAVSDMTGTHAETVRRYLQGQAPSAEFLSMLCKTLELNAHWLLLGEGAMRNAEAKQHALREADPAELLAAVASSLEALTERVARLEVYVQGLESHVRTGGGADGTGKPQTVDSGERAGHVADALPERPRPDAGGDAPRRKR